MALEFCSKVNITSDAVNQRWTDTTAPGLTFGLQSEVGGQLYDFGSNYVQLGCRNTAYAGGFIRVDLRGTYACEFFTVRYIPSGGTVSAIHKISRTGDVVSIGSISGGSRIMGTTCVSAPKVCGTTCIGSPLFSGATGCFTTCTKSAKICTPLITGGTVCATTCFVGSGAGLTGTASSFCAGTATNALCLGGSLANTYAKLASPSFTGQIGLKPETDVNFYLSSLSGKARMGIVNDAATDYSCWELYAKAFNFNDGVFFIDANNKKVGIGTTSPLGRTHICAGTDNDSIALHIGEPSFDQTYGIRLRANANTGVYSWYGWNNSVETANPMIGMNRGNGYVGIGTASIDAPLHVVCNDNITASDQWRYPIKLDLCDTTGGLWQGTGVGMKFHVSTGDINADLAEIVAKSNSTGGQGQLILRTGTNGTLANNVIIDECGKTGIGTVPSQILHVKTGTPVINIQTCNAGTVAAPVSRKIRWGNYLDCEAGSINVFDSSYDTTRTEMAFSIINNSGALTEAMRINYNGNLQLNSVAAKGAGAKSAFFNSDGTLTSGTTAGGSSQWSDGASNAIYYNSGNVGIGTTNPFGKLDVNVGTNQNFSVNSFGGYLHLEALNDAHDADVPVRFDASQFSFMSGNLGIGIASPAKKLVVSDGGNIGYEISPNDGANGYLRTFAYNRCTSAYVDHLQQAKIFMFGTGTSPVERMRIDDSGNVGVGTTAPEVKLHVKQDVNTGWAGDNNQGIAIENMYNSDNFALLGFRGYTSCNFPKNLAQIGGRFTSSGSYLYFGTSCDYSAGITNSAMIIDYTGNVNLTNNIIVGTTSSTAVNAPNSISLGGSFSCYANSPSRAKFKFYDAGGDSVYGLGVSSAQFEFHTTADARYSFQFGGVEKVSISNTGLITTTGDITANRIRGNDSLVLNTFGTVQPSSNVRLYSPPNDRDAWVYLDSADATSNWGIYHRQIDTAVGGLPGNSFGFIGGGNSALKAYINIANGDVYSAGCFIGSGAGLTGTASSLTVGCATSAGSAGSSTSTGCVYYSDTRGTDHALFDYKGISIHLKYNTTDGLSDGGSYHGTMHITQWGEASGGAAHQLGFTANGNIYHRSGTSSWGSWLKLIQADASSNISIGGCGTAVDWIATSDCRIKTNIKPITNALSTVMQLQGVCYNLCADDRCENHIGLVAQDVEKVLPVAVAYIKSEEKDKEFGICDDKLGLKYEKLTAVLIEAMKEQQKMIDDLKQEIQYLKNNSK